MSPRLLMLGLMSVLVAAEAEVAVTTGAYLEFLPSVVYLLSLIHI